MLDFIYGHLKRRFRKLSLIVKTADTQEATKAYFNHGRIDGWVIQALGQQERYFYMRYPRIKDHLEYVASKYR
jgi:hypothetical protein